VVLKRNCIIIFYRLISQDGSRRAYFALRTVSIFTKPAGYFDQTEKRSTTALKDGNFIIISCYYDVVTFSFLRNVHKI